MLIYINYCLYQTALIRIEKKSKPIKPNAGSLTSTVSSIARDSRLAIRMVRSKRLPDFGMDNILREAAGPYYDAPATQAFELQFREYATIRSLYQVIARSPPYKWAAKYMPKVLEYDLIVMYKTEPSFYCKNDQSILSYFLILPVRLMATCLNLQSKQ